MTSQAIRSRYVGGLGLTDLLVGLAIGMLATLVVLKVGVLFETRRKATTGIADAQTNASLALAYLARQLRMAGHGLGPPEALGCTVRRSSGTALLPDWKLWPVTLIDGKDGAPDKLLILSSGQTQSIASARLITDHAVGARTLMVNSTLGMNAGDSLLLYDSGNPECLLIRISETPTSDYRVNHSLLPSGLVTAATYRAGTAVINLGNTRYQRFSIDSPDQLMAERHNPDDDTWQGGALAIQIVNLQAQFGYDARSSPSGSPQVTRWSAVALDANGDGIAGDANDKRRILAVRIAIVARSAQYSDQGCQAETPSWWAANETSGVMELVPIAVNTRADWACFRYRVLQTEIPLRNLIWSDT